MDDKIIQNAFQEIRDFFKLPEEEKKAVHFHKSSLFRGYEDLFATKHETRGQGGKLRCLSITLFNMLLIQTECGYERGLLLVFG